MKVAVMRRAGIAVEHMPDPVPSAGEILVKTLACGICGTDVRTLHHAHALIEEGGGDHAVLDRGIVMGHEFCAEIVDYGPDTQRQWPAETRICALPVMPGPALNLIGYSPEYPGGFGELMRVSESMTVPVPDVLSVEQAVFTEPLAVAVHAVSKVPVEPDSVVLVVGCGTVGLAVIAVLRRLKNVRSIVAADPSPRRRALAEVMGASRVVDPAAGSPYQAWAEIATALGTLQRRPFIEAPFGEPVRPATIFDCAGAPGVLPSLIHGAPKGGHLVVVGACMQPQDIRPLWALGRELRLSFSCGYRRDEFVNALTHIANGEVDLTPLVTGTVNIDHVPEAFDLLSETDPHVKIVVKSEAAP